MGLLHKRLRRVDRYFQLATVSMGCLSTDERRLAVELCETFGLRLGSLLRRADAIRLAGGHDNFGDCLREAAQHLILRSDDHEG